MATLGVERLDHLILTVRDVDTTCAFYQRVLGMQIETFGHGRKALRFGRQKINVEIGEHPAPGGTHLCFITTAPLGDWIEHLKGCGVLLREGPVKRNGAEGPIESLYLNDPDDNSIEIARY